MNKKYSYEYSNSQLSGIQASEIFTQLAEISKKIAHFLKVIQEEIYDVHIVHLGRPRPYMGCRAKE
jgi:hypothetical protein